LLLHAIKKNSPDTIFTLVDVLVSGKETPKEKINVIAKKIKLPKHKSNLFSVS
jgi:hypothetical protein